MAYISCLHRPGSTRLALKLALLEPDNECLVLARANRLEIYTLQSDETLQLQNSQILYGNVSALKKFRPASATTDHLFVLTDRSMYFTLSWDGEKRRLRTETSCVDLSEFAARDSLHEDRCHIDSWGKFLTVEIHEGIVHVIPFEKKRAKNVVDVGTLGLPVATRIPELGVKSSALLHKRNDKAKPQLALLYTDHNERLRMVIREMSFIYGRADQAGDATFTETPVQGQVEAGASHIIALPPPVYGFLVIGETSISFCDEFDFVMKTKPLPEATIFVSWTHLGDLQFLLGDDYGRLWLLAVDTDSRGDYTGWSIGQIGTTARASTLVYLDQGIVFLGSHNSDSQLLRIHNREIEVLQTFSNLAPIIDFTVMDMGNRSSEAQINEYSSGQARLVTGSGAYSDGSLRSVRSGVGVDDLGTIGAMQNITDLFGLRLGQAGAGYDTLIASSVSSSRAFRISANGELEELDNLYGIDMSRSTLLADCTSAGQLIHVSPESVALCDDQSSNIVASWKGYNNKLISLASFSNEGGSSRLMLSLAGAEVISVFVGKSRLRVTAAKDFGSSLQVSCLATSPVLPGLAAIGFWQQSRVSIVQADAIEEVISICVEEIALAVPRSLAIARMASHSSPILFVGMANGEVVSYALQKTMNDAVELVDRKGVILGNQQAKLKVLRQGDSKDEQVVALCEHPSLIYGSEGRLVYSAITAEEATCVCNLDNEAFPGAIAFATEEELKLATVDREKTTHVQTLQVGKTVRRLAYSAHFKAFLLGTIKRTLREQAEHIQSYVELVDEVAFKSITDYALNEDELIGACVRAELDDGSGEQVQGFVVGTQYIETADPNSNRGRLLVFEVSEDRRLKIVSETRLKGACHCLAMSGGKIVAGLMRSVAVFALKHEKGSLPYLDKLTSFRVATLPVDIAVSGNIIAVSDLMKSVTLLELDYPDDTSTPRIVEIARHRETVWATCISPLEQNMWLQADAEMNLIIVNYDAAGFSEEDRHRLKVTSEFRLGEMVNRIHPITVQPSADAPAVPRAFCATVEGGIYLVSTIAADKQNMLMQLQENMAEKVPSLGNVDFGSYRAFHSRVRSETEPLRFVDEDLIEQFLTCDDAAQTEVSKDLADVSVIRALVENLKRMH